MPAARFEDFEKLVDAMSVLLDMSATKAHRTCQFLSLDQTPRVQKEMLRVIFHALDDNLDGVLDWSEFEDCHRGEEMVQSCGVPRVRSQSAERSWSESASRRCVTYFSSLASFPES